MEEHFKRKQNPVSQQPGRKHFLEHAAHVFNQPIKSIPRSQGVSLEKEEPLQKVGNEFSICPTSRIYDLEISSQRRRYKDSQTLVEGQGDPQGFY